MGAWFPEYDYPAWQSLAERKYGKYGKYGKSMASMACMARVWQSLAEREYGRTKLWQRRRNVAESQIKSFDE